MDKEEIRKKMRALKRQALIEKIMISKEKRKNRTACIEYAELKRLFRKARNLAK